MHWCDDLPVVTSGPNTPGTPTRLNCRPVIKAARDLVQAVRWCGGAVVRWCGGAVVRCVPLQSKRHRRQHNAHVSIRRCRSRVSPPLLSLV